MKIITHVESDGYEATIKDAHVDTIHKVRVQNTDPYYEQNQMLRNNIGKDAVTRDWAMPIGQIPFADYQNLVKKNPELKSKDAKIRTAAWLKVLKTYEQLRTVRKSLIPGSINLHWR